MSRRAFTALGRAVCGTPPDDPAVERCGSGEQCDGEAIALGVCAFGVSYSASYYLLAALAGGRPWWIAAAALPAGWLGLHLVGFAAALVGGILKKLGLWRARSLSAAAAGVALPMFTAIAAWLAFGHGCPAGWAWVGMAAANALLWPFFRR